MITNTPRWTIKLTHEPTGVFVEVNSNLFRTQQEAKEAGTKLLKSRLYALFAIKLESQDKTIKYTLPDNIYWPEELQNYKEPNI